MRRLLLLPLMLMAMLAAVHAQGIQFKQGTLKSLLDQAKKENKLVFVDCYTTWCGPCKWMEANVFPESKAGSLYNTSFVCTKFDMEKGEGITIAEKYGVQSYPTYLFLDGSGKEVHRAVGSSELNSFLQVGVNAKNPETQLVNLRAKYDSGVRDTAFLGKYLPILMTSGGDPSPVANDYLNALGKDKVASKAGWKIISNYIYDMNSPWVAFVDGNPEVFSKVATAEEINNWFFYLAQDAIRVNAQDGPEGVEPFKELLRKRMPHHAEAYELAADYYFRESLPMEESHPYARAYFDEYCMSSNELNAVAWSYFERAEDADMLATALNWARRSVTLHASSYNLDTEANLLAKLGNWKEAEKAALRAIELAEKEGSDADATQDLLTEIRKHL